VSGFIVFYRIGVAQVEILRVIDGRRDLDEIFGDEICEEGD